MVRPSEGIPAFLPVISFCGLSARVPLPRQRNLKFTGFTVPESSILHEGFAPGISTFAPLRS
jgi:hypothetical protein